MTTDTKVPRHPAKFHPLVLAAAAEVIAADFDAIDHPDQYGQKWPWTYRVLDPFAGVGGIHQLADPTSKGLGILHAQGRITASRYVRTTGVELEPAWAAAHPDTIVGNVLHLSAIAVEPFDALVTSPCYGNRMADAHEAKDLAKCPTCDGYACEEGCGVGGRGCRHQVGSPDDHKVCRTCKGSGRGEELTKRNTYRHALGHELQPGSAAAMQWGTAYRTFHTQAWAACLDVLKPGGLAVVNVKNHIRGGVVQRVVEWHCSAWLALGCYLEQVRKVETSGLGEGDNFDARVPYEVVMVFRVPDPKPERRLA